MKNPFRVGCAALVATVFVLAGQVKADATSLHANDYLFQGQQLAMSCYYSLRMQSDGNLVLYDWRNHAYWASNTVGRGAYAVMQQDGNFVVYDWTGVPVWDAATMNSRFAYLVLQSDRNLVIYDGYGSARWASNTVNFSSVGTVIYPCGWKAQHTSGWYGYDLPGSDYGYYQMSGGTPQLCASYCAGDSRCVAYTYVPPGVQEANARCWVKSSTPGWVSAPPGFFSGMVERDVYDGGNL
jgi:hypothetical protein